MLKINKNLNDKELTIALEGHLDTISAPELETKLKNGLSGVESLVMDLKGLEYISSAGLRVLLYAKKTMDKKGSMKIINVNEVVNEVFEVTGFIDILDIE